MRVARVLRSLRPTVAFHCCQSGARDDSSQRKTESTRSSLHPHPRRVARMKHRTSPEQHHGKKPRVPAAAASTSVLDGMEDKAPSNPRELTQNPLKKIWMPCKNGLPEKHIYQRKGAYVWRRITSAWLAVPPPPWFTHCQQILVIPVVAGCCWF